MPKFTVYGHQVDIDEPYSAGHAITEGEADALNQVRKENIRNNVASVCNRMKEKENREPDQAEVQKMVSDYAENYEFGVRSTGARDPVESEAMDMARQMVRDAINKKGLKLKDFAASRITELASGVLAGPQGPTLRERAKAVVEARGKVAADLNLDDVKVAA